MFKKTDPYSFTKISNLKIGETIIGSVYFYYQISLYEDVQSNGPNSVNQPKNQRFLVNCTQRINIYNPDGMVLSPSKDLNSYNDYPAMLNTIMSISGGSGFVLQDYSPKTVNTQVQTSGSLGSSDGQTKSNSSSNTVGSSISETNTFGTSVTVGDSFSGASANYEHSSTITHEKSSTKSNEIANSRQIESSSSASMSIKDWGAYSLVNPGNRTPSWTFGQEYPWNAIQCRKTTGEENSSNKNQVRIVVPTSMLERLYDGNSLYPPSELSTYGINFVTKASWLVEISDEISDEVVISHNFYYFTGSHILPSGAKEPNVYIDNTPIIPGGDSDDSFDTTLNLNYMALNPLGTLNPAAVVGFIPNKFIIKPKQSTNSEAPVKFKVISSTNDLMINDTTTYPIDCGEGVGFKASETSLIAGFNSNCTTLQMTLNFKVIDSISNYMFYMKHWKTGENGVLLTLVINNDPDLTLTQYIDDLEAEGGENNMTTIALRNQNFTSVDYHDYLQLGLNSIQITIEPIGGEYVADCGYQLRALSIESS